MNQLITQGSGIEQGLIALQRISGAQSIERAIALLRFVASYGDEGTTLTDLVGTSQLTKPTCRRILIALIEGGLIEQDPSTRRYYLGSEISILGSVASSRYGINRLAMESVKRLAHATGDAAFFQVRRGWFCVCLHREDGDYPIRTHVLSTGGRYPLGVGAGGMALLAHMNDGDTERALQANRQFIARHYPSVTATEVDLQLEETRQKGYSINRGFVLPGSWGIAMTMRDQAGHLDFCLSLAAIESRMQPERETQLAALLREEVERVEAQIHDLTPRADMRGRHSAKN